MRRLLRHPLLHFLALGALLHLGLHQLPVAPEPIVLDAAQVEAVRAAWHRETGRAPNAAELQASLRRHADEEMLVREALHRGLDQRDAVVRERLLRNIAFLFPERALAPAQALLLARELGMAQRDVIARRRLVQLGEARLASGADAVSVPVRAAPEVERRALEQRWFSGPDAEGRAGRALVALRAGQAAEAGDAFLLGTRFAPLTQAELERRFGGRFAQAAMQAEVGAWQGPLRSNYGLHLIRVERVERRAAPLVHPYRLHAEREAQALRAGLGALRARYPLQLAQVDR